MCLWQGQHKPVFHLPTNRGKTLSAVNKKKRLDFAQLHIGSDYKTWVFTDAKDLYLYEGKAGELRFAWQELNTEWKASGGALWHFRFYAAVAYGNKSKLYFVPPTPEEGSKLRHSSGKHTAATYIKVLQLLQNEVNQWFPDNATGHRYSMIQDNAPQHTANRTKRFIRNNKLPLLADWPAQSWDLNIIEDVWGVLNEKLAVVKSTDSDGWRAAIEKAWGEIDVTTVGTLVDGVSSRMEAVVASKGRWVHKL